jgi:ABC-type glycerol-3-phosphate transport system substrate-binding protein
VGVLHSAWSIDRSPFVIVLFAPPNVHAIIATMRAWYGPYLAGIIFWLVACGATNLPLLSSASETPTLSTPAAADNSLASATRIPVPTHNSTPDASQPVVLTCWVPEEFATGAERGGDVLEKQIAEFQVAHPNVKLNYVLKAPYGKGGMVDWLTQLQELMPDRLPDAAILDSRDLDSLEKLGLLHPLNRDLPSGAFWDLFSPAQTIARRSGQWNNQPLIIETEHLVYDARRFASPPASWQEVLTNTTQFAFAADSTETFLFHYLEYGGSLDPTAHPVLDASVMQAILEYYQRARANGDLNENTAVMKSAREVMPLFISGQVPMAQVRAKDFLLERERLPNALAAPIPTRDGRATALVSSWSFVILSNDPAKQGAATSYLEWIIDPARMGEWSNEARLIPASKSAFAQSIEPSVYTDVLWQLIASALVAPSFSQQAPYADAWHTAVEAVLSGQLAPDDAAFRAVQAITQ